jgi:hypothetical protein
MSCTVARTDGVSPSTCRKTLCRRFSTGWTTGALCRICCTKRHRDISRRQRKLKWLWGRLKELSTMRLTRREIVAVKRPAAGIVGVKGDGDAAHRGHEDGIAHGTCEWGTVYRDHLESVTMKMHRVRHHVWFSISIATRWPVAIISGVTLGQYSPFSDQAYGAMAPARITRCVTSGARGARGVTASRHVQARDQQAAHFRRPPRRGVTQVRRTLRG